jgi:dTMP kinase
MTTTGKFVVIEGIDKSGKTTICRKLKSKIEKDGKYKSVVSMSFPNRKSVTGQIIDKYLGEKINLNPEVIHLLFSANRWEQKEEIKEHRRGSLIICDRYFYSGVAYSVSKGLDMDWCMGPDRGLPMPDLVVFIDIGPQNVHHRSTFGMERYENIEYLDKVYCNFKKIIKEGSNSIYVDGNAKEDEIVNLISAKIYELE